MKVTIPVTFDVEAIDLEEDDEMEQRDAEVAAELAIYHFLTFCTVSGANSDTDEVTVHVDGFGECTVRLGLETS